MKSKHSGKHIKYAVLGVLVLLIVLASCGIAAHEWLLHPDTGADKFTGVKGEVAQKALKLERIDSDPGPLPYFVLRIHVDSVRPISLAERHFCEGTAASNDVGNIGYYAVVMTEYELGDDRGPRSKVQYGCNIEQLESSFGL